ncbi:MAG: pyridoxamine kinase [Clostridia bacterium]|nr:pyridoxamine kinase [Clostridia bacterium]
MERIAVINDISCFGRCSLTVAMPIISSAGIEVGAIPTAVLSTHTGGFKNPFCLSFSEELLKMLECWERENIKADCVLSGYLSNEKQIEIVKKIAESLCSENGVIIVDPVMGDNGRLYSGFDECFPQKMLQLCKSADIITPNITEACMLLGKDYTEGPFEKSFIEDLLISLSELTGADVVLTGVYFERGKIGAGIIKNGMISYAETDRIDALYHGTGDVFASAFASAVVKGKDLNFAAQFAADFTKECIKNTAYCKNDTRFGVNFEEKLYIMGTLNENIG